MAQPWLKDLERLSDRYLPGVAGLECKHFFSGAALYVEGVLCASLSPVGLAFRLTDELCSKLIGAGVARPLRYFEKSPVKKGYALFAEPAKISGDDLGHYFAMAVERALLKNTS